MDKKVPITESWKEVKEYIEYCFGWRTYCNAICWTSTPLFLEPHMKAVEDEIQNAEKYKKAMEIVKNKKVDMKELLGYFEWENGFSYYNEYLCEEEKLTEEEWDFLKEVFGENER